MRLNLSKDKLLAVLLVLTFLLPSLSHAVLIRYDYTGTISEWYMDDSLADDGYDHPDLQIGRQFTGHLYWDPEYEIRERSSGYSTSLTESRLFSMTIDQNYFETTKSYVEIHTFDGEQRDVFHAWNLGTFYMDFDNLRYFCDIFDLVFYGSPSLLDSSVPPEGLDLTQFDNGYFRTTLHWVREQGIDDGWTSLSRPIPLTVEIDDIRVSQVPEPTAILLMIAGCSGLLLARKKESICKTSEKTD